METPMTHVLHVTWILNGEDRSRRDDEVELKDDEDETRGERYIHTKGKKR